MLVAKIIVVTQINQTSLMEMVPIIGLGLTAATAIAAFLALRLKARESRRLNQPLLLIQPIVVP